MDHIKNYKEIHNRLLQFIENADEDKLGAWVDLGSLLYWLRKIVCECDDCEVDDKEESDSDRKEFVDKFKSCLDSLKELRQCCEK